MSDLRSEYLSKERIVQMIEAMPGTRRALLGDAEIVAYYSFGCELHHDLLCKPMRVHTNWMDRFVRDSLKQGIVVRGISDFDFTVPENKLFIGFCHECDIHLGGEDSGLLQQLMGLPPFSEMKYQSEPGA